MPAYSFARCLENSYRINWKIEDVLGDQPFDLERRWLPLSLSGASRIDFLSEDERRRLTQVEMAAYAHLFAYVEEFIAPKVTELAAENALDQRVDATLGFDTALVGGQTETARFVLSKSTGAVLLLTACLEWFTQLHYTDAFKEDDELDELTKRVFKAHWLEESQHAQMDHIETLKFFDGIEEAERDRAVDDLIELVVAVDGLLQAQVALDLENFARHSERSDDAGQTEALRAGLVAAKRWTFLESGVTHPRFQELFLEVTTPAQQARVADAIADLLGSAKAAA